MMASPKRRWALRVLGASFVAAPLGALMLRDGAMEARAWQGESLGGPARLELWSADARHAESVLYKLRAEIERLEAVFSLYRHDSELAQLNRNGGATNLSSDLRLVLQYGLTLAERSNGAFDPTVQPLWRLYAEHFRQNPDARFGPDKAVVDAVLRRVDYRAVKFNGDAVQFLQPDMATTLNGLAQGHITDRVAELLEREGFAHAVIDCGETRTLGAHPDGSDWEVAIKDPEYPHSIKRLIPLFDAAVSVSGGYGTPFGRSDSHHIFDPRVGRSARTLLDAVVVGQSALEADGLSTAIFVAGEEAAKSLLSAYPNVQASVTRLSGEVATIAA